MLLVSKDGHAWDTPGGRAEANEGVAEALQRECREEAGVDVNVGNICFTQETFFAEQGWRLFELFFRCTLKSPLHLTSLQDADGSTSEVRFFSVDEMRALPVVRPGQLLEAGWLEGLPEGISWGGSLTRTDRWKGAA